jgi:hypothetical protein
LKTVVTCGWPRFFFIFSRKCEWNLYCDVDSALDVTSVKFESEVLSDALRLSSIKLPLLSENLLCHLNTNERLTLQCVTDRLMNLCVSVGVYKLRVTSM